MNRGCVLNILSIKTGIGRKKRANGEQNKKSTISVTKPCPLTKMLPAKILCCRKTSDSRITKT
jgi:hypothetical protein